MAKKIISASVPEYIADWLKNDIGEREKSAFITSKLEKAYKEQEDPIARIKVLEREKKENQDKLDYYYHKIQRVIEDGNKKEREEAKRIKDTKEAEELEHQGKLLKLLDKVRVHEGWETFVNNYEDLSSEEIVDYNEVLNKSDIQTGGWGKLKELMSTFTKEQLKGGVVLLESEDVGDVENPQDS